jgi:hypothetical protein
MCAAARWVPDTSDTSASHAEASSLASTIDFSSEASSTVGVLASGTLSALGLKLRMGQRTAHGARKWSKGVAPETCTIKQEGDIIFVMAVLTSDMRPSVTAMTTTSASRRAPAASLKLVLHEHPKSSPKGWADSAVRLTT